MNILRRNRKNNRKISLKRYILLIFSLIMSTFAWFTYSKILNTGVKIDIKSWDIAYYVDEDEDSVPDEEEEVDNPIGVDLSDLYPGMEEKVVKILIQNNGETPTDILFTCPEINILGNDYEWVETAPAEGEYYILKTDPVIGEDITTTDFINEPQRFPFKIVIEHTQEILSGEIGYLTIKVTWPIYGATDDDDEKDRKDELDTEWGYKFAKYIEDNASNPDFEGAFKLQVRINAIGKPRTDYSETMTAKIVPSNYGQYVNYPVDLNNDGNTKNDWKIFYNNGNNVYLIAADYVKNSLVSTANLGMTTAGNYNVFWNDLSTLDYTIDTGIATKFLLSKAATFTETNANYQATASLLDTEKWTSFVDDTYAESAIGSPTIEMFTRSWNQVYTEDKYENQQIYCNSSTANGYYVGNVTIPNTNSIDVSSFEGLENGLYFPHHASYNSSNGYWLSSPSVSGNNNMLRLKYDGTIGGASCNSNDLAIRPIVCIKNSVDAEIVSNVWNFVTE